MEQNPSIDQVVNHSVNRRRFLGYAGGAAGLAILGTSLAACHKDDNNSSDGINLGSGDTGILNYAYALEQLEAAFYTMVCSSFYTGATTDEMAMLTEIKNHEVIHRELFKAALGNSAIQGLTPVFTSIDFTSRASVLGTAKAFEDLGVSAYNGAGKLISNADYLTLAGKIVSVEARHAAYIRELLQPNSFVANDVVSGTTGMEISKDPSTVLATAGTYIKEKLNASNLPTS